MIGTFFQMLKVTTLLSQIETSILDPSTSKFRKYEPEQPEPISELSEYCLPYYVIRIRHHDPYE